MNWQLSEFTAVKREPSNENDIWLIGLLFYYVIAKKNRIWEGVTQPDLTSAEISSRSTDQYECCIVQIEIKIQ